MPSDPIASLREQTGRKVCWVIENTAGNTCSHQCVQAKTCQGQPAPIYVDVADAAIREVLAWLEADLRQHLMGTHIRITGTLEEGYRPEQDNGWAWLAAARRRAGVDSR